MYLVFISWTEFLHIMFYHLQKELMKEIDDYLKLGKLIFIFHFFIDVIWTVCCTLMCTQKINKGQGTN